MVITRFSFWHFASNKRMTRKDARLARELAGLVGKIEDVKKDLIKDREIGSVAEVVKDATHLAGDIGTELGDLEDLNKHAEMQDYDLMRHISQVIRELEKMSSSDPQNQEFKSLAQRMESLSEKVHKLVVTARIDARNLIKNRDFALRYSNLLGLTHIARLIRREERAVRREVGAEEADIDRMIKDNEQIAKLMKNARSHQAEAGKEVHEKEGDFTGYVKDFLRNAEAEADNLYHIELNDAIFLFHLKDEIWWVEKYFIRIKKEGFPEDKQQEILNEFSSIQGRLRENLREDRKSLTYLKRHSPAEKVRLAKA